MGKCYLFEKQCFKCREIYGGFYFKFQILSGRFLFFDKEGYQDFKVDMNEEECEED